MYGDYLAFLTIDHANYVYIETYQTVYLNVEPVCEKVFVCDRSPYKKIETRFNSARNMIVVFLYNGAERSEE
jgi:hypothetical protein